MIDQTLGSHYGYKYQYTPTIMDGPVIRWGIVSASRNGVMLHNYNGKIDVPVFSKLLLLADETHRLLIALGNGSMEPILSWLKRKEIECDS